MPEFVDLTGKQFGRLTVLQRAEPYTYPPYWVCKCECGNIKTIKGASLTSGRTKSCGCLKEQNLIGKRFGYLTVIELLKNRAHNRQKRYRCLCDCGNYTNVNHSDLLSGNTKSCGCYNKKLSHERFIDIAGLRFGNLVVLEIGTGNVDGVLYWKCKCDCGNLVNVPSRNLREGKTISCGCVHSKGEQKIIQLLQDNGINYKTQDILNGFKYADTNGCPRFDFGIYDQCNKLQYLIEYDGVQHFEPIGGWNNKEAFAIRHSHDMQKNTYCLSNKIPLIRIPYWHYDDLCIEDLLINTTLFLLSAESSNI